MNAEGSISFVLKPRKMVEPEPCRVRTFDAAGVTVDVVKYPQGTVDVEVAGPHGRTWSFTALPAVSDPAGVEVAVTWDPATVALHMGGSKVQEQQVIAGASGRV
jgi:hypothetical protein